MEDRRLPATVIATYPIAPAGFEAGMVKTPDGDLWMINVNPMTPGIVLDRIDPATGAVSQLSLMPPDGATRPTGQLVTTADGNLWFPLAFASPDCAVTHIGRFDPASGTLTEYAIPLTAQPNWDPSFDGAFGVRGITVGPDGAVWFDATVSTTPGATDQVAIGRITDAGDVTLFPPVTAAVAPLGGITTGVDGNLYFTTDKLYRVSPAGAVTQVATNPAGVVFGVATYAFPLQSGAGGDLWGIKLETSAGAKPTILRVDPQTGDVTEYPLPATDTSFLITSLTTGPDGNLWIAELDYTADHAFLARLDVVSGDVTQFPLSLPPSRYGVQVSSITTGPDGNFWFDESLSFRVDRLDMKSLVTASGDSISPTATEPWSGEVATFSPVAATAAASDYTAVIDYGDGTTGQGSVAPGPSGGFIVSGTHTYATAGSFAVSVSVIYQGVDVATAAGQADVGAPPAVMSVQRLGLGTQPTRLTIQFSAPLDANTAQDVAHYAIVPVGPRGHRGHSVRIVSAAYDPATGTVTLTPAHRLRRRQTFLLQMGKTPLRPAGRNAARSNSTEPAATAASETYLVRGFVAKP